MDVGVSQDIVAFPHQNGIAFDPHLKSIEGANNSEFSGVLLLLKCSATFPNFFSELSK